MIIARHCSMAFSWRKFGRRVEIITLIALVFAVTYLWTQHYDRPVATPAAEPAAAAAQPPAALPKAPPADSTLPGYDFPRIPSGPQARTARGAAAAAPPATAPWQPDAVASSSSRVYESPCAPAAMPAASPNTSGETRPDVTLKIATLAPDASHWATDMRAAAEEIDTLTGGRVAIRLYTGGVQGSDEQVLKKIRIGLLQGAALTPSALTGLYPDLGVYDLPFLFDSADEAAHVRRTIDPILRAGLEDAGFVSFCFASTGFARLLSTRPVYSLADVQYLRVWIPQDNTVTAAVLAALGLEPVPMPLADVFVGLASGFIDLVPVTPVGALVLQLHTRADYLADVKVAYTLGLLALDRRTFAKLQPADQAVVRNVFDRLYRRWDTAAMDDNMQALNAFARPGSGTTVLRPDPAFVADARQRLAATRPEIIRAASISPDLHAEVMRLIEEYRGVE